MCLLEDILAFTPPDSYVKLKQRLQKWIPYAFASCVFPMSFVVLVNFWGIYPIKPDLIDEDNVTATFIPLWINHGLHTNIVLLVLIEKFLVHRKYPAKIWGFAGFTAVVLAYSGLCLFFNVISGLWPYPLFRIMNNIQKILYLITNCLLGFLFFVMGDAINKRLWGKKTVVKQNAVVAANKVKEE